MAKIVREKILENIEATFNLISKVNGYENDIASFQRWLQAGNSLREVPCIVISAGPEEKTQGDSLINCRFNVNIDVWIRHDEATTAGSTDTIINSLLGDVEKALFVDYTRGGFAVNSVVTGNLPFESVEGNPYAGIIIDLEIQYRHAIGDLTQEM